MKWIVNGCEGIKDPSAVKDLLAALRLVCELGANVERYGLDARPSMRAAHKAAYAAVKSATEERTS